MSHSNIATDIRLCAVLRRPTVPPEQTRSSACFHSCARNTSCFGPPSEEKGSNNGPRSRDKDQTMPRGWPGPSISDSIARVKAAMGCATTQLSRRRAHRNPSRSKRPRACPPDTIRLQRDFHSMHAARRPPCRPAPRRNGPIGAIARRELRAQRPTPCSSRMAPTTLPNAAPTRHASISTRACAATKGQGPTDAWRCARARPSPSSGNGRWKCTPDNSCTSVAMRHDAGGKKVSKPLRSPCVIPPFGGEQRQPAIQGGPLPEQCCVPVLPLFGGSVKACPVCS